MLRRRAAVWITLALAVLTGDWLLVPRPSHGEEGDAEAAERLATLLSESRAVIDDYAAAVDRAEVEVAARAALLGDDVDAIAAFVRDEVRYEPYRGALRGAEGCLQARAGNAWDRALLLAALLRAAGHEPTLAWAELDAVAAAELVTAGLAWEPSGVEAELDLPYYVDDEELAARRAQAVAGLEERIGARFERLRPALAEALGLEPAPAAEGEEPPAPPVELVAVARDHAWVRVGERDLDPSLGLVSDGASPPAPAGTGAEPPADRWHRVTLRGRAETVTGGEVAEEVLFEVTRPAAELHGAAVLAGVRSGGTSGVGVFGDALAGGGGAERDLVLRIGGEEAAAGRFALEAEPESPGGGGGGFGGLSGGLNRGLGGGAAETTQLVSVSLGVEVAAPEGEPEEARLYLLDRWGYAGRSAGEAEALGDLRTDDPALTALDGTVVSLGVACGRVSPDALQARVLEATQAKLASLVVEGERLYYRGGGAEADARLLSDAYYHTVDAWALSHLDGRTLPLAVRLTAALTREVDGRATVAFDVTDDAPTALDRLDQPAAQARFERGLLASIVEEELTFDPLDPAVTATGSARALEDALAAGPPRVVREADQIPAATSPDARARTAAALAAGRVVALPATDAEGEARW